MYNVVTVESESVESGNDCFEIKDSSYKNIKGYLRFLLCKQK